MNLWEEPCHDGTLDWRRSRRRRRRGGGGARRWDSQQNVLLVLLEDAGDVLEDIGREQVDAAVDDVAHKRAGLLHVVQDLKGQDAQEGQIKVD